MAVIYFVSFVNAIWRTGNTEGQVVMIVGVFVVVYVLKAMYLQEQVDMEEVLKEIIQERN